MQIAKKGQKKVNARRRYCFVGLSFYFLISLWYTILYMRGFKTFFIDFVMPLRPALPSPESVYLLIIWLSWNKM